MDKSLVLGMMLLVLTGCAAIRPAPYSATDPQPPGVSYDYRRCTNEGRTLGGAPWWCRTLGHLYANPTGDRTDPHLGDGFFNFFFAK